MRETDSTRRRGSDFEIVNSQPSTAPRAARPSPLSALAGPHLTEIDHRLCFSFDRLIRAGRRRLAGNFLKPRWAIQCVAVVRGGKVRVPPPIMYYWEIGTRQI